MSNDESGEARASTRPRGASRSELRALAARRWRVATALTAMMMATYFGFIFLVAYAKSVTSVLVTTGLSLGILLGALVIVVAWIVTGIYVRWANNVYDRELATLMSDEKTTREEKAR